MIGKRERAKQLEVIFVVLNLSQLHQLGMLEQLVILRVRKAQSWDVTVDNFGHKMENPAS